MSNISCNGNIQILKLGAFKSEKELTKKMRTFFDSHATMLILQCYPKEDGQHIPLAKYQLEEMQQEYAAKKKAKSLCIVFHIERSAVADSSWQFSFLSGWRILAVDSVEDQVSHSLKEICSLSVCDILKK